MKKIRATKKLLAYLSCCFLLGLSGPISSLSAQSESDIETKIQLLSEALAARQAGDLQTAKNNLETLLEASPEDAELQRLLASVERAIEDQESAAAAAAEMEAAAAGEEDPVTTPTRAQTLAAEQARELEQVANEARVLLSSARQLIDGALFDEAIDLTEDALDLVPPTAQTADLILRLEETRAEAILKRGFFEARRGDREIARSTLNEYRELAQARDFEPRIVRLARDLEREIRNPANVPIDEVSPDFLEEREHIDDLLLRGRAQFINGDLAGSKHTFSRVEAMDPTNPQAKAFLARIADIQAEPGHLNRQKTRANLLQDVADSWGLPQVYVDQDTTEEEVTEESPIMVKLREIRIPSVNFSETPLSRVVSTLNAVSQEYDDTDVSSPGVNIVLIDREGRDPDVTIALRDMSLNRILDFIVESVGFQYTVQEDVVVVAFGEGARAGLDTEIFEITQTALQRMTGIGTGPAPGTGIQGLGGPGGQQPGAGGGFGGAGAGGGGGGADNPYYNVYPQQSPAAQSVSPYPDDPFGQPQQPGAFPPGAFPPGAQPATTTPTALPTGIAGQLRQFLQQAGVDFDGTPGSSIAYDGSMIVTQTPRNLTRIRNIVSRYTDVRQVEIEARFLEVQEGALDELGIQWGVRGRAQPLFDPTTGLPIIGVDGQQQVQYRDNYQSQNRTLSQSVTGGTPGGSNLTVVQDGETLVDESLDPPGMPGLDLGEGAAALGIIRGSVGGYSIQASIRALARKTGSDLLSAPKITVRSGRQANIVIAQEFIFPTSFGQATSQVGQGGQIGGAGDAGVTITAGDVGGFETRNVGVELLVTPTVEADNRSISLELSPRVTEFEGFVEYGGPSVAISGGQVVTIPSANFQPIFNTREIDTEVVVYDGATLVMGGLTREEIRTVRDEVPVLGRIPVLGRLFRSEGEASSKRNLLIFVTANIVTPGGSLKNQELRNVSPRAIYQDPTWVTPGGPAPRIRIEDQ